MKRWEALAVLQPRLTDALVVACNGMPGRDLFHLGDRSNQFYMVGSMGLASSIGLGLALAQPRKRVVVIDGDGNVLMNLGGLANIGAAQPANLFHVILDNGRHASTGGQKTISGVVKLEQVAQSMGYRKVWRVAEAGALKKAMEDLLSTQGPACLLVEIEPGNQKDVPRVDVPCPGLAIRFRTNATQ